MKKDAVQCLSRFGVESIGDFGFDPPARTATFHTRTRCLLASTRAWMRAAAHALAARQNSASQGAAQHRAGKGSCTLRALIKDVKAPRVCSVVAADPSNCYQQFRQRHSLVGFRFSLLGHTRCGRHFRGREAAALDPPTDRYGRKVTEEKVHRDQVRCALLTGAPHSHACAGELSADGPEPPPSHAGHGPGCRRDGHILKPGSLQTSCQDAGHSPLSKEPAGKTQRCACR